MNVHHIFIVYSTDSTALCDVIRDGIRQVIRQVRLVVEIESCEMPGRVTQVG